MFVGLLTRLQDVVLKIQAQIMLQSYHPHIHTTFVPLASNVFFFYQYIYCLSLSLANLIYSELQPKLLNYFDLHSIQSSSLVTADNSFCGNLIRFCFVFYLFVVFYCFYSTCKHPCAFVKHCPCSDQTHYLKNLSPSCACTKT